MIKVNKYQDALTNDIYYLAEATKVHKRVCNKTRELALIELKKKIRKEFR